MSKVLLFCTCIILGFFVRGWLWPDPAYAQEINETYQVGTVTSVLNEQKITVDNQDFYIQEITVKENNTGEERSITSGSEFQPLSAAQRLRVGSQVIMSDQTTSQSEHQFVINDMYRLPILVSLLVFFGLLVILVAGKQGTLSIVGMFFSLFILIGVIVPRILAGENPFFITLIGASLTAVITMYLSHGFKRQTHIALFSMIICLALVAGLSNLVVKAGHFLGLGSEEAAFLQFGPTQKVNLQGLFLAGILLGALGILDDITLAQTAVIEQLKAVNPKMTFEELYNRGLTVGKDHVASLVNTLVFAYAGTSLPLFLLFTLYRTQPSWVIINSEVIAEEIIRTLVGSIGLVLAVPLTTLIASYYVTRPKVKSNLASTHTH